MLGMNDESKSMTVSLNIDCSPGCPRPDSYCLVVFQMLKAELCEPDSKTFGNWHWTIENVDRDVFSEVKDSISAKFNNLYERGKIRYFEISAREE